MVQEEWVSGWVQTKRWFKQNCANWLEKKIANCKWFLSKLLNDSTWRLWFLQGLKSLNRLPHHVAVCGFIHTTGLPKLGTTLCTKRCLKKTSYLNDEINTLIYIYIYIYCIFYNHILNIQEIKNHNDWRTLEVDLHQAPILSFLVFNHWTAEDLKTFVLLLLHFSCIFPYISMSFLRTSSAMATMGCVTPWFLFPLF